MISNLVKDHDTYLPKLLKEIGTNHEQLKNDVKSMRKWYSFQTHLPQHIEDCVLATFIIGSKNSMERAKMKIDQFYSYRRKYPQIYGDYDPMSKEITKSYKTVYTILLPKLLPDISSVAIFKLKNLDPSLYDELTPMTRINMMLEVMLQKTILSPKIYIVYDNEGCTSAHLVKLNPLLVKTTNDVVKILPLQVKGIITINCTKIVETSYNLVKSFLSEKIQNRLFIYSEGYSILSKHIPKNILPKDYGGEGDYTLESLNDMWNDCLIENRDWLNTESYHNSDESKRPADSPYKPDDELYGTDGSFKKLTID